MKGMLAALWQIGRKIAAPKATREYPEEQPVLPPRSRGRIVLTSDPDGQERCVACGLCAAVCPVDCIAMAKGEHDDGRWYATEFRVNFSRCIFCGLCEEACPTSAIQLTPDYHLATANRASLVHEKADLTVAHQGKAPGYRYWAVAGKAQPTADGADNVADNVADPGSLLP